MSMTANATVRNIQKYGKAKYGNLSDHALINTISAAAKIPNSTIKNYTVKEPPKNHFRLGMIADTLGVPIERLVQGSLNDKPATHAHGERNPRTKFPGLRRLVRKARHELGVTHRQLAVVSGISKSALDLMVKSEMSNRPNLHKLLTLMQLPTTHFDAMPDTPATEQPTPTNGAVVGATPRLRRKKYYGLAKLILKTEEELNVNVKQLAEMTGINFSAMKAMKSQQISNQPNLEKFLSALNLPTTYLDPKERSLRAQTSHQNGFIAPMKQLTALTPAIGGQTNYATKSPSISPNSIIKDFILRVNNNFISGETTVILTTEQAELLAREILIGRDIDPDMLLTGKAFAKVFG